MPYNEAIKMNQGFTLSFVLFRYPCPTFGQHTVGELFGPPRLDIFIKQVTDCPYCKLSLSPSDI